MATAEALEQYMIAGDGATDIATVAAAHQLLGTLPRITTRIVAFGSGLATKRAPWWVKRACDFEYLGTSPQGRVAFRAKPLIVVDPRIGQKDLFADLDPNLTAFSILGQSIADVVNDNGDSDRIDEVFLRRFHMLAKRVVRHLNVVTFGGLQGASSTLMLGKDAPEHAIKLLHHIPPPVRVRLVGSISALRLRGDAFELSTQNGVARCTLVTATVDTLRDRFGEEIAIGGTAYFRPSGRLLRVEVDGIDVPRRGDARFARLPTPVRSAREQAQALMRRPDFGNWLGSVRGKWPGDETEAELNEALRRH